MLVDATPADCAVMASIHAASFSGTEAWSKNVFSLQLALPNVFGLLHPSGGFVLIRVAADEAEVLTLAVLPEARRTGIGGMLLRQATIRIRAMAVRVIFLEVSVANIAAKQLYLRSGVREAGRRPHYYSDNSDALVLRLDLDSVGCR